MTAVHHASYSDKAAAAIAGSRCVQSRLLTNNAAFVRFMSAISIGPTDLSFSKSLTPSARAAGSSMVVEAFQSPFGKQHCASESLREMIVASILAILAVMGTEGGALAGDFGLVLSMELSLASSSSSLWFYRKHLEHAAV
jgi:hypothetical protein